MSCDGPTVGALDLDKWREISPHFIVPADILLTSVKRAKRDVALGERTELDIGLQGEA